MAVEKVAGFISAPRMCVNISMKSAVLKPSDVRTLSFQTLRLAELHEAVVAYQIQQMSVENKLKGNIAFKAKHLLFFYKAQKTCYVAIQDQMFSFISPLSTDTSWAELS